MRNTIRAVFQAAVPWAAGFLVTALWTAGCTLAGDTSPGDIGYWNGGTFTTGKPKTVYISGIISQGPSFGRVKLFSTRQTLAQARTGEAAVQSGPELEPISANGKSFQLYVGKSAFEWKTAGDYFVYFFLAADLSEEPRVYENDYSYSGNDGKIRFTEENPDYILPFSMMQLMVSPEQTVP